MDVTFIINLGSLWVTKRWVLCSFAGGLEDNADTKDVTCIFIGTDDKDHPLFFVQEESKYVSLTSGLMAWFMKQKHFTQTYEGNDNRRYSFTTQVTLDKGTPITV